MAEKAKPANPILRYVQEKREHAQEDVLRGPSREDTPEQNAVIYAWRHARYVAYREIEEEVTRLLADGDD